MVHVRLVVRSGALAADMFELALSSNPDSSLIFISLISLFIRLSENGAKLYNKDHAHYLSIRLGLL